MRNLQLADYDSIRKRHWVVARWLVITGLAALFVYDLYVHAKFGVKTNDNFIIAFTIFGVVSGPELSKLDFSGRVSYWLIFIFICAAAILIETTIKSPIGHLLDGLGFAIGILFIWISSRIRKIDGRRARIRSSVRYPSHKNALGYVGQCQVAPKVRFHKSLGQSPRE